MVLGRGDAAVVERIGDAPSPATRAAAVVVVACGLMGAERDDEAIALLTEHFERDDLGPVDHAWLLVQRARARANVGAVADARADAVVVQHTLLTQRGDVTASALGAAAAWLLFHTAGWTQGKLDEVVTAGDTAVAWWRTQTLSWGLAEAAARVFRGWADEQTLRIEATDEVNNNLFSATLTADLAGEHQTWRSCASLLGRNTVLTGDARHDSATQVTGLHELRHCGDVKSVELAAARYWSNGPAAVLRDVVQTAPVRIPTHTTAETNLALWRLGGDLLDEVTADAVVSYLLGTVADPAAFTAAVSPTFLVEPKMLDALAGVLPAAGDVAHRQVAESIGTLPSLTDALAVTHYRRVVGRLRAESLDDALREHLRAAALHQPDAGLSATILKVVGDGAARAVLAERVAASETDALGAFGAVPDLPPDAAAAMIGHCAELVRQIVARARQNTWSVRGFNSVQALVFLNAWFPEHSRWDEVLDLLREPNVSGSDKRDACLAVVRQATRLPDPVAAAVATLAPTIVTAQEDGLLGRPLAGAAIVLAGSVGALTSEQRAKAFAALAAGSRHERRDAAFLVAQAPDPSLDAGLTVLATDSVAEVRSVAAHVLVSRVADGEPTPSPVAEAALRRATADPGVRVPQAIASTLANLENINDVGRELARSLSRHASATVRIDALRAAVSRVAH